MPSKQFLYIQSIISTPGFWVFVYLAGLLFIGKHTLIAEESEAEAISRR